MGTKKKDREPNLWDHLPSEKIDPQASLYSLQKESGDYNPLDTDYSTVVLHSVPEEPSSESLEESWNEINRRFQDERTRHVKRKKH